MSPFEYAMVLISIIVGLAITHNLAGLGSARCCFGASLSSSTRTPSWVVGEHHRRLARSGVVSRRLTCRNVAASLPRELHDNEGLYK